MHLSALKTSSVVSLITGITMAFSANAQLLNAELTGKGSSVIETPPSGLAIMQGPSLPLHSAAFAEQYEIAAAGQNLVIGILLILLGFFLHAYVVAQSERKIPVHEGHKSSTQRWYWVEMKV
jgi:hypothetical protein